MSTVRHVTGIQNRVLYGKFDSQSTVRRRKPSAERPTSMKKTARNTVRRFLGRGGHYCRSLNEKRGSCPCVTLRRVSSRIVASCFSRRRRRRPSVVTAVGAERRRPRLIAITIAAAITARRIPLPFLVYRTSTRRQHPSPSSVTFDESTCILTFLASPETVRDDAVPYVLIIPRQFFSRRRRATVRFP